MEPHLTQHELWPCDPIIIFKSQFKVCDFQICYIAAKSKSDNYKPISILKHTLWDPCVTQFEMQLFDPIITFKCWFKVCHFQVCCISAQRKNGNCKPISISKHTLMEPHLTQHELWPCDPIIIFKSQFKVCHFQIWFIAAKSKSDNYKPISILKHTLWDPCVTQFEMQLFDPIITFKCWFKVCHIFHYIVIQGKVI